MREVSQVRLAQGRLCMGDRNASGEQAVEEALASEAVSRRSEAEGAVAIEQHALLGDRVQGRGVRVIAQSHRQTHPAPARVGRRLAVRVQAPPQLVGGHGLRVQRAHEESQVRATHRGDRVHIRLPAGVSNREIVSYVRSGRASR